jgi:sugar/nucleoside kinase (ribokinase family)
MAELKKYDAILAGYICVDLLPEFKKEADVMAIAELFKPGRLIEIDGLSFTLGGVVANTGGAMKLFGKKVLLNGLIGNDFIGKIAKDWLTSHGLAEGIEVIDAMGTAFGLVIAPPGIDRIFLESPGCSQQFDLHHINFEAIANSRLFHFGYPPLLKKFYQHNGAQLVELLSKVQELGVVTSVDFSLPDLESESGRVDWKLILTRILPYTDIFLPSIEEILQMIMPDYWADLAEKSNGDDVINLVPLHVVQQMGRLLLNYGAKIVLIKLGHRGAYLLTGDVSEMNEKAGLKLCVSDWNSAELWCDAYPADPLLIKSASGAGDVAAAAFLAALLDGEKPATALQYTAQAGRNSLYCHDMFEGMINWDEMTNEINKKQHKVTNLSLIEAQLIFDTGSLK